MYIEEDDSDKTKGSTVADEDTGLAVGAGGSGPSPDSKSSAAPVPQQADNSRNQNFATVQDYLKNNVQQGNDLGDKFSAKLDSSLNSEKSAIDSSSNAFGNEVTQGTVFNNQPLVDKAASAPTEVANNPGNLTDWLKQYNASYTGPASFESSDVYDPAGKAGQEATQNAALVKDTGGREQLLQNEFNDYGQGNRGLDQALLENSGKSADIQAFAPKFAGVADYLKQASGNAATAVSGAEDTTQAAKDTAHTAIDGSLTGFQKNLQDRVDADKTQAQSSGALSGKLSTDLASGNADAIEADLKESGVPDDQLKSIADYLRSLNTDYQVSPNLSSYYKFNPASDITPANVATPEDYQNAGAYKTLTGVGYDGVLDPANSAQAGTWSAGAGNVNTQDLTSYLKTNLGSQDSNLLQGLSNPANFLSTAFPDPNNASVGGQKGTQLVDAIKRTYPGQTFGFSNMNSWPKPVADLYSAVLAKTLSGGRTPALDAFEKELFGNLIQNN